MTADNPLVVHEEHVYKTLPDVELRVDVHKPAGARSGRPVILWLHAGAMMFGDRQVFPGQAERYVDAGFTVVSPDYRLAPEASLEVVVEDVTDAYSWVTTVAPGLLGTDTSRVIVVGHSAGGYLAQLVGFRVQPRPRAVVSFYGYGDLADPEFTQPDSFYARQAPIPMEEVAEAVGDRVLTGVAFVDPSGVPRWRYYMRCRQLGIWLREVSGHDPIAEADWFASYAPILNIDEGYPPTLLIHGTEDTDVPYGQSVRMAEALGRHGVEHELITMSGSGHAFDVLEQPDGMAALFDRVVAFCEAHVS